MQANMRDLIARLKAAGIRLALNGEKLVVSTSSGLVEGALLDEVWNNEKNLLLILKNHLLVGPRPIDSAPKSQHCTTYPLSHAQLRFWFLEKLRPGSNRYKLILLRDIAAKIDVEILERAILAVATRHQPLRTIFDDSAVPPLQVVMELSSVRLEKSDLSGLPDSEQGAELDKLVQNETKQDFNFSREPAFRSHLVKLAADKFTLIVAMHHLISDGWSVNVFFRELVILYDALLRGHTSPLKALTFQYGDYVRWQHERLNPRNYHKLLSYWRGVFSAIPSQIHLPSDVALDPKRSQGAQYRWTVEPSLVREISEIARTTESTPYVVLLTAFAAVIAKFCGREEFCVGTPVAGRNTAEFFPLIGCFADTLALRISIDLCQSFRTNLLATHKVVFGALAHQEMPFNCLVEELNPPRDDESSPIFQMLFALHTEKQQFTAPRTGIGRAFKARRRHTVAPRYGLSLDIYPSEGGGFEAVVEYDEGKTSRATIANFLGCMARLLESAKTCLDHRLGQIDILNSEDRIALQRQKAETLVPFDSRLTLYTLFLAQADKYPDFIAIDDGDRKITYGALKTDVLLIADRMQTFGVRSGDLIAVIFDRSIELVTAILAVWGAGAAYLPLDPVHPNHRLNEMLLDAKPFAILFDDNFLKSTLVGVEKKCDALTKNVHFCLQRNRLSSAYGLDPSAAYAIYTSGSTGAPKAAVITHSSLVNLIQHMEDMHSIGAKDVVLSVTSPSFDLGGSDIFLALSCGAQLVLASRSLSLDAPRLLHFIERKKITILQATPATWSMLNAANDRENSLNKRVVQTLRVAICGGEALSRKLIPFLCRFSQSAWNYYGPTETTVWSTSQRISESEVISVGRPIANTQVLIVDSSGNLAPSGAIGEIWIGGSGVALGYLNRPELTEEKFVVRSFFGESHRFYRTGDIGRYQADGTLQLIGRNDRQIKIRGFRVELEEIESSLASLEGVESAHVRQEAREDGSSSLSGFIVQSKSGIDAQILRRRLGELLPQYMVPDVIYLVPKICLTANSKIDWVSTRKGALASSVREEPLLTDSLTTTEATLQSIWAELLKVGSIFSNSDFFSLGGHSLLVLDLLDRIEKRFDTCIDLSNLFRHSTLSGMASQIDLALKLRSTATRSALDSIKNSADAIGIAEYLTLNQRKFSPSLISLQPHIFHISLAERRVVDCIDQVLNELEYRHPLLGMVLIWNGGDVLLAPRDSAVNVEVRFTNHSGLELGEREPLSLGQVGLYDVAYLQSFKNSKYGALQFRLDNTFFDYECCSILRRCFSQIANSRNMQDLAKAKVNPEKSFLEYLKEERYKASTEAENYWREKGKIISPILHFGEIRPELFTKRANRLFRTLLSVDVQRLKQFSIRHECSVSQVLLTAFGLTLGRLTNRKDVPIAMQSSRRTARSLADALGIYQSQFYVDLRFSENSSLESDLSMVVEEFRRALSFSTAPPAIVWGPAPGRPSRSYGSPISAFYFHNEIADGPIHFPSSSGQTSGDLTLVTYEANNAAEIGLSLKYYADGISTSIAKEVIDGVVEIVRTNC